MQLVSFNTSPLTPSLRLIIFPTYIAYQCYKVLVNGSICSSDAKLRGFHSPFFITWPLKHTSIPTITMSKLHSPLCICKTLFSASLERRCLRGGRHVPRALRQHVLEFVTAWGARSAPKGKSTQEHCWRTSWDTWLSSSLKSFIIYNSSA